VSRADYADWPFWPEMRSDADQARWWDECYVEAAADRQLPGVYHWFLLVGGPGSGKTVARRAWLRRQRADSLVLRYPPERWPGSPKAWFPDNPSHLAQMMATAGLAVAERLQQTPALLDALGELHLEFLRALLQFMGGERHYRRFVAALPRAYAERLLAVAVDGDFFGDGYSWRGVQSQIEELSQLLRGLGLRRALYVIDPPTPLGPEHAGGLADLFGWLDLTDNPGFAVAAVARDELLAAGSVLARARGRAGLVYTDWTALTCHRVAERHLSAALPDAPAAPLAALLTEDALAGLDMLVAGEYGRPTPAAWAALAETLLYVTRRAERPLVPPLMTNDLPRLKAEYFRRHVLLRLDPQRGGVWRGPRFIPLNSQPLRFLQLLQQRGDHPVNWDDNDLRLLAGSKNNVHSIASRARRAIEPVAGQDVYLCNRTSDDGGYWLENCAPALSDRSVTG
jgi:hypothetical protein